VREEKSAQSGIVSGPLEAAAVYCQWLQRPPPSRLREAISSRRFSYTRVQVAHLAVANRRSNVVLYIRASLRRMRPLLTRRADTCGHTAAPVSTR
jgi:hypothetical protein